MQLLVFKDPCYMYILIYIWGPLYGLKFISGFQILSSPWLRAQNVSFCNIFPSLWLGMVCGLAWLRQQVHFVSLSLPLHPTFHSAAVSRGGSRQQPWQCNWGAGHNTLLTSRISLLSSVAGRLWVAERSSSLEPSSSTKGISSWRPRRGRSTYECMMTILLVFTQVNYRMHSVGTATTDSVAMYHKSIQ